MFKIIAHHSLWTPQLRPRHLLMRTRRCSYSKRNNIIASRISAQHFDSNRPVPDRVLAEILTLTQRAPTSFNLQPYACIVVREAKDREQLSTAMLGSNRDKVQSAPITVVFAADLEPSKRVPLVQDMLLKNEGNASLALRLSHFVRLFAHEGRRTQKFLSTIISPLRPYPTPVPTIAWSYKQTAFAIATLLYAAELHHLVTCPMEGFDEIRLKNLLHIPDRYSVPAVVSLGYSKPGTTATPSTRLSPSQIFFDGKFGRDSHQIFACVHESSE